MLVCSHAVALTVATFPASAKLHETFMLPEVSVAFLVAREMPNDERFACVMLEIVKKAG